MRMEQLLMIEIKTRWRHIATSPLQFSSSDIGHVLFSTPGNTISIENLFADNRDIPIIIFRD